MAETNPCRFEDGEESLCRIALSEGCLGYPDDREQDVCLHHFMRSTPLGEFEVIASYALNATVEELREFRTTNGRSRGWGSPTPRAELLRK